MLKTRSAATLLGVITAYWSSAMRKDRNEKDSVMHALKTTSNQ